MASTLSSRIAVGILVVAASVASADDASQRVIDSGREQFTRVRRLETRQEAGVQNVDRMFNAESCVECHKLGGIGGAGPNENNVQLINTVRARSARLNLAAYEAEPVDPPQAKIGPGKGSAVDALAAARDRFINVGSDGIFMLHRRCTSPDYADFRAGVIKQGGSGGLEERNTPPLFGLGLIASIPQTEIDAIAADQSNLVRGRSPVLRTGSRGRFGWKCQTATLADFNEGACAAELGLKTAKFTPSERLRFRSRAVGLRNVDYPTAPDVDMTADDLTALTAYVAALPAPVQKYHPSLRHLVEEGEALFRTAACHECHVPKVGAVAGLYSDLLLHDVGTTGSILYYRDPSEPPLGPGDVVRAEEIRTPPLWGVADSAPYLHDGSAATLDEAIRKHAVQAQFSTATYREKFTDRERDALTAFLLSLRAPQPAETR